jgi:hypothetical protein
MNPLSLRRLASGRGAVTLACALGAASLCAQDTSSVIPDPGPMDRTPVTIFFPPLPPPLDVRIQKEAPGPGSVAPPDLMPYVGEIFYPPLGARMARRRLSTALRERVERYRDDQAALVGELRAELSRVPGQEPASRLRALETLAKRHAPRLADLDNRAEQLRKDLIESDSGWDDLRDWHLSVRQKAGFSPQETAAVMKGAAFYLPHLHPVQRGLLREIAFEVSLAGPEAKEASPFVFFSPELARIRIPGDLSPAAAESFAAYQAIKAGLKKELYDAIAEQDQPGLNLTRGKTLRALAERQAPEIAALEAAAENFRRQLPPEYGPAAPRSVLPAALFDRVVGWSRAMVALRQETMAKVEALGAPYRRTIMLLPKFDEHVLEVNAHPWRGGPPLSQRERDALQAAMNPIAAEYASRYAGLADQKNAIDAEIGRAIGTTQSRAIAAAFSDVTRIANQNALAAAREDYRAAVFEPGLSPAQRRLLLSAAMPEFGLRLPGGEKQPMGRMKPGR